MKVYLIIKEVGVRKFIEALANEIYRKIVRQSILGSYAQDYEDLVIEKILPEKHGFYLEIGAYDPTRLSNTFRFYKKGWRGVVVEPNPEVKDKFTKLRPLDRLIPVGIGPKKGKIDYYHYLIPALNTFSKNQVAVNKNEGYEVESIEKIEVITIDSLLRRYVNDKKIGFLSLDIEGWDERILSVWSWEYKPKVICVEKDKKQRITKLLEKQGYVLKFENKDNAIYGLL